MKRLEETWNFNGFHAFGFLEFCRLESVWVSTWHLLVAASIYISVQNIQKFSVGQGIKIPLPTTKDRCPLFIVMAQKKQHGNYALWHSKTYLIYGKDGMEFQRDIPKGNLQEDNGIPTEDE